MQPSIVISVKASHEIASRTHSPGVCSYKRKIKRKVYSFITNPYLCYCKHIYIYIYVCVCVCVKCKILTFVKQCSIHRSRAMYILCGGKRQNDKKINFNWFFDVLLITYLSRTLHQLASLQVDPVFWYGGGAGQHFASSSRKILSFLPQLLFRYSPVM